VFSAPWMLGWLQIVLGVAATDILLSAMLNDEPPADGRRWSELRSPPCAEGRGEHFWSWGITALQHREAGGSLDGSAGPFRMLVHGWPVRLRGR
jgi:hypothetical protein